MKDMDGKANMKKMARLAAAALAAAFLGGCGCNGGGDGEMPAPADPKAEVKERMADAKYTAAIEKGIGKRNEIQTAMMKAKARLDEAVKAGADEAAVGRLKKELADLRAKFDANQKAMEEKIRARLLEQSDTAAAKQAKKISK